MTAIQFILIVVSILLILLGILLLTRSLKSTVGVNSSVLPEGVQQKDGLPILPRNVRNFSDNEVNNESLHKIEDLSHTDEMKNVDAGVDFGSETAIVQAQQPTQKLTEQQGLSTLAINPEASNVTQNTTSFVSDLASTQDEEGLNTKANGSIDGMTEERLDTSTSEVADSESVLNQNLTEDRHVSQNNPLHTAQETLNINILPNNEFASIKGIDLLKLVEHYGFKFGEMNMFHRYQNKDGTGILWFSMMGLTAEGITPFDLNTIPNDEYQGLALFLSLPHPKAFQGFDSMMSIASLMARELNAQIIDDHGKVVTTSYKKLLRSQLEQTYSQ